jgi:hypothetical protein
MRALAVVAFACALLSPEAASAKRVIRRPTIASECRSFATWNQTARCIRRFGPFKVLHETTDLKLISVGPLEDDFGVGGRYLFGRHQNEWRYTGALGSEWKIEKISPALFDGHKVHRIDVSRAAREEVALGEGITQPGWVTQRLAMLCSPEGRYCESVMTACDVVVRGKTFNRFRGTITYVKDGELLVVGDRGLAGASCAQGEHAFLPIVLD